MDPNTEKPEAQPEQTINEVNQQQSADAIVTKPASSKKLFGRIGAIPALIGAVFLLAAGSAAAYYGIVLPNQPENVLKTAFENTAQQKKVKFEGKLTFESTDKEAEIKAANATFNGQSDIEKSNFQVETEITASGVKLPLEIRLVDSSLYAKFGDLSTVKSLVTAAAPEYAALFDAANEKLANIWIEADDTLLKQAGLKCSLDTSLSLSSEDIDMIQRRYSEVPFANVRSTASEDVNGRAAYKYEIDIDDNKGAEFAKGIDELPIVKKLQECSGGDDAMSSDELADNDITPLTIWVDKADKTVSKIASHSTAQDEEKDKMIASFEIMFTYGEADVTKPNGARPAMEVLGELQALLISQFSETTGLSQQSLESMNEQGDFDF